MNNYSNPKLTPNARKLRKNMTKEERHLWYDFLKTLPLPVKRQKVIGRYIADFYIPAIKTVIEIDGSQHYEVSGAESDRIRDGYFEQNGISVLRYSNYDVNVNFQSVCEDIWNRIENSLPLEGKGDRRQAVDEVK